MISLSVIPCSFKYSTVFLLNGAFNSSSLNSQTTPFSKSLSLIFFENDNPSRIVVPEIGSYVWISTLLSFSLISKTYPDAASSVAFPNLGESNYFLMSSGISSFFFAIIYPNHICFSFLLFVHQSR